jgi:two-component system chemotaxis response regulator CheB
MPPEFTGPFSRRLDGVSKIEIKEAAEGDELLPNRALIAPGGKHVQLRKMASKVVCTLSTSEPVSGHRPSVDVLFKSAASIYGTRLVGVIMTGMGRDGADGCKEILAAGGRTFGQNAQSSVVYGMNKVAFQEGGVQSQFSLDEFPSLLRRLTWAP